MIQIKRPAAVPARLEAGGALVAAMDEAIALRPNVAGHESEPFVFEQKIYGHSIVKRALKAAQHDKCAYCEAIFAGNASGDVEHFRPKAFQPVKQSCSEAIPATTGWLIRGRIFSTPASCAIGPSSATCFR